MNIEGTRWVEGAVLGLAMLAVGCTESDPKDEGSDETDGTSGDGDGDPTEGYNDTPLELELAVLNKTGKYLLLRFSEPMAPVGAVDPAEFRLSLAVSFRELNSYYGGPYTQTTYWDPLMRLDYQYYYGYSKPMVFDLIANGNTPTDIALRLVDPMTPSACANFDQMVIDIEELDATPEYEAKVGIFPHYSPGATPIRSVDGEVLKAIGSEWVEFDGSYSQSIDQFDFINLDPQIPIACGVTESP